MFFNKCEDMGEDLADTFRIAGEKMLPRQTAMNSILPKQGFSCMLTSEQVHL